MKRRRSFGEWLAAAVLARYLLPLLFSVPEPRMSTNEPWSDQPPPEPNPNWEKEGEEWKANADRSSPKALPPGCGDAMRLPDPVGPVKALNGCPKCKGPALISRRDKSRWCPSCDERFEADFAAFVAALPETREAA